MPTLTLTYPAAAAQRFAVALGKAWSLKDNMKQPRSATADECKLFLIQRAKQLIVDVEGPELEAARGSVIVPDVDIT